MGGLNSLVLPVTTLLVAVLTTVPTAGKLPEGVLKETSCYKPS
jgi:hypothetical protein